MTNYNSLDPIILHKQYSTAANEPLTEVVRNAIIANGIEKVAYNTALRINLQNNFNIDIKTGKITSQEKSGRCWTFAGLNIFRNRVNKALNTDDFEFSQNYLMFFDKLEKGNYFLESIIATQKEDIYSRIVMWLLREPIQDGGQWVMFTNLIKKYGALPKSEMPETFHSNNSAQMNTLLTAKLRHWASVLRQQLKEGISKAEVNQLKNSYIQEFYGMLSMFLGIPPLDFMYDYRNKEGHQQRLENMTPQSFFTKYVQVDLEDYVSLIHAPTPDKPFWKTYTVEYLGNVAEGNPVLYLNAELEDIKLATISQLKADEPVWFGCDVRLQTEKLKGLMDKNIYHYDLTLGVSENLDKAGRLLYGESLLTHAMVFTGVNMVNEKPTRWKVENSWGEDRGEKGFFIMSDNWFDEYTYQVVIQKQFLPTKLIELLNQSPTFLPPWDPMGSLAS